MILSAESLDEVMDQKKRSRSFQDPELTRTQIIREVLAEYGGTLQCENPSVKIGASVLQYEETDWEFCRRMAGSMGFGIFGHVESACPQITVGPVKGKKVQFSEDSYRCGVDESYYHQDGILPREWVGYDNKERNYTIIY